MNSASSIGKFPRISIHWSNTEPNGVVVADLRAGAACEVGRVTKCQSDFVFARDFQINSKCIRLAICVQYGVRPGQSWIYGIIGV